MELDLQTNFCWSWRGSTHPGGYGSLRIGLEKPVLAHRMAWVAAFGYIPDGLCVLHSCDNPSCVNPGHLFLGTQLDNMRDKVRKGRLRFGVNPKRGPKRPRFNAVQIDEIRNSQEKTAVVARRFAVPTSTIWRIRSGRSYGAAA